MSLRTPRRKISPRARRRYRAIRNFFKRTLSSLTSLSAIKVNASSTDTAVDLIRTDRGHQLSARQNHQNLACARNLYRRHTENLRPTEEHSSPNRRSHPFGQHPEETKVLYKTSNNLGTNSYDCGLRFHELSDREQHSSDRMNYGPCPSNHQISKRKPKKARYDARENLDGQGSRSRKNYARTTVENSMYSGSTESFAIADHRERSHLSPGYSRQEKYTRELQPEEAKLKRRREKPKRYKSKSPHMPNETRRKKKKNEQPMNDEQQFIADIINKQYKPLSFFGRRASDISQISTPVCRDQRFSTQEVVIPESEVSSLCQGPVPCCQRACAEGMPRLRECATCPVSPPWPSRQRRRRAENYNDTSLYDVVPVKEKTSPKSRRKFIEDHMILNEVPPSPRTQRPRLILETQNYSDYEDYEQRVIQSRRRHSPYRRPEYEFVHSYRRDMSTEQLARNMDGMSPKITRRLNNTNILHDDIATAMSSRQCLTTPNYTTNNTLNDSKVQDQDDAVETDKTDKALCEIKHILQNFLQELKKDSSTSQCDRTSGSSNKNSAKNIDGSLHDSGNEAGSGHKNVPESPFNCGLGQNNIPVMQQQFMPGHYGNPCCYPPMIPMYGAHGMPYLMASPSCVRAGAACGHSHPPSQTMPPDPPCRTCSKVNCSDPSATKTNCETDVLIREIYNYVAGNLNSSKNESSKTSQEQFDGNVGQKQSVGKSMHALHHDANVGTHPLRCYSKSCEAIVSRQHFDTYYSTYPDPTYSNSLLEERISRDAVIDYQMPRETNEYNFVDMRKFSHVPKQQQQQPSQDSKFMSALKLLRKNSKKSRKEIHEVCQSEQTIEVDVMPKARQNFKQEFATYTMHGQEFIHPPPLRHDPRYPLSYEYDYSPYDSRRSRYPSPSSRPVNDRYSHYDCMSPHPTASMYDSPYESCRHNMEPQSQLCLKEVEVRSVGIQSEKKPHFRLFPQKKESVEPKESRPLASILRDVRPKSSTHAFENAKQDKARKFFNSQAAASKSEAGPSWAEKMQKDITKNDKTVSNAMLKKLFYKRNPFSPQNAFMRTIMEKDTPVFKWRPRIFI